MTHRRTRREPSRREFLKHSAVVAAGMAAAPYFFSSNGFAADSPYVPPVHLKADRPKAASIGLGTIWNFKFAKAQDLLPHLNILAICDLDQRRLVEKKEQLAKAMLGGNVATYEDYRRVLDRPDIAVVHICTPDHWHAKIAIEALHAGKDVYCEKPLSLTIDEGKQICAAVKKTGRVFQVGTQQRTEFEQRFFHAVAMVHDGRIGKVKRVTVGVDAPPSGGPFKSVAPPKELNWERWQGQTPVVDYIPERCHEFFRWWFEYSGGKITDWGAHHVDIAQWALGYDKSGPKMIEPVSVKFPIPFAKGYPTRGDSYNTPIEFVVKITYPGGEELILTHGGRNGLLFEGEKGHFFVNRGTLVGKPVDDLAQQPLPADLIKRLYKGK
ncbi:MAG: Gfo/Idh/MocA family oxidoreductase, partial [Planctomycetia bacterium]|nr:Gfo/Idh/MocA family oxidoreductase [Planctomycetia bacterium]